MTDARLYQISLPRISIQIKEAKKRKRGSSTCSAHGDRPLILSWSLQPEAAAAAISKVNQAAAAAGVIREPRLKPLRKANFSPLPLASASGLLIKPWCVVIIAASNWLCAPVPTPPFSSQGQVISKWRFWWRSPKGNRWCCSLFWLFFFR